MNAVVAAPTSAHGAHILNQARELAQRQQQGFAGTIHPVDAWQLVQNGEAVLVDVRTSEELRYVGQVPKTLHIPWATGSALTRNPRFVRELESKFAKDQVILFLCRSGKRSMFSAQAASKAGFTHAFNVADGFEGELDANMQRGRLGGWRYHSLPWVQE